MEGEQYTQQHSTNQCNGIYKHIFVYVVASYRVSTDVCVPMVNSRQ